MELIKTTFFSGIITIIRIASGFISSKVIATYTGPAGIALIGAFANFINIVLTFGNGAISTGVIKYTAEFEGDDVSLRKLFSTSLRISVYCSAIVGVLLIIFGSTFATWIFATSLYSNPIRVLGLTLILYSLNTLFISILNGKKQINVYTLVNTVGSIGGLLITTFLVFYFDIYGALYALVLSQSLIFFVTLFFISKTNWFAIDDFIQSIDRGIFKKLTHYSLMAVISALTIPVSQIILRKMLINTSGIQTAGIWQGMMRISDGYLLILTTGLTTYYLPKLSSLKTDGELRVEILNGYRLVLPIVFIMCIVMYAFRYFIIEMLYTPAFYQMSELFFYQLLGDFFKIASWILGYLIVAKSMTKIYVITEICSSLLYVLLGYVCVFSFGPKGIAIAFAVNYFLYFLLMLIIFRKLIF